MTRRVKILLLVGLLLIWGTQVFFSGLEPDDSDIVATQPESGQAPTAGSSQGPHASIVFSMPAAKESVKLATPRNIFAPLTSEFTPKKDKPPSRRPSPPTKPQPPVAMKSIPPKPVPPAGPTPEQLARRQAEQEMNKYHFLGYLERAGEQHVFLSNGQALYIVKQGETVEGAIKLKSIMDTSVVLSKSLNGMDATVEATLQLIQDGKGT